MQSKYSLEEAKESVLKEVFGQTQQLTPEETTVIPDDSTIERYWGWVFFPVNQRYYLTGNEQSAPAVGGGPIFFFRETGEIKVYGSGDCYPNIIYDYEMEDIAKSGCWCLWLTDHMERKQTILNIKTALALSTADAKSMVPKLPHCLFTAKRRQLDLISKHLMNWEIKTEIKIERDSKMAQHEFDIHEWLDNNQKFSELFYAQPLNYGELAF